MNYLFESRVLEQLVLTTLDTVDNVERAEVVANVVYSYNVIKDAAQVVQRSDEFLQCEAVQKLRFSQDWVRGWLRRQAMRRRRCTAQMKDPKPVDVQTCMAEIQKRIVDGGYEPKQVLSGDETAILFGQPPKNQYIPGDASRGFTPEGDDKARFTSFLGGTAEGMLPSFST